MRIAALLVAAGTGTRFGSDVPKQFVPVGGSSSVRRAAEALASHVDVLLPVGDAELLREALSGLAHDPAVAGGATRQDSVRAGLEALAADPPDVVLVHDAARPVLPDGLVADLLEALTRAPGAIPALPVADTLKRARNGRIVETVSREELFRAQTPQAFRFAELLAAHRTGPAGATDDAALMEAAGHDVLLVRGDEDNIKLTYPEDLSRLARQFPRECRVGAGFDVHAFADGRDLILCGVRVPHERGLAGHSDADVGLHALCDAIYGALGEGDIGRWFPPSEAEWKDADSARFLRHAAARIAARGGSLVNCDVTLICERPKVTPHAPAMIARVAELLGVDPSRVSVKATTTERLGFTGRGEGIAAQAAVSLSLPA
jgi:2-C-methyl-D-erythritol 4-phosphate cytidylyltransferase/2-C-methyl-D-erythritol 2,4-cyclodiphosphate synthase